MKNRLTKNISLKIMSLIAGILVWLIVVNIDDPTITATFTIPDVDLINEAYIDGTGKMCMLEENQEAVRVHITGQRSAVRRISMSDLHAVADVQQAVSLDTDPVMVPITVTCERPFSGTIDVSPKNLSVHLREKKTQEFVVNVTSGESKAGNGYEVGTVTANPEMVRITGPSSLINKIASVSAAVNVDGRTADVTEETNLVVIDKNGEVFPESEMNYLNLNRKVTVTAKLWKVRSNVRINADYTGGPKEGYQVAGVTTLPDVISVAGSEEGLRNLALQNNEIWLPAEDVDISGRDSDMESKINIMELLPDGVKLTSDFGGDVLVRVKILPEGSFTYDLMTMDIAVEDMPDHMQAAFETERIEIRVKRRSGNADDFDADDIEASVNLKGREAGTYEVPVQIRLPDGYELVNDVTAEVRVSEISSVEQSGAGGTG